MRQLPLGKGRFALVDDNDFEMLAQYRWAALRHFGEFARLNIIGDLTDAHN